MRSVVYSEEYAMGHLTAALLSEAGVELRRLSHGPPQSLGAGVHAVGEISFDDSFSRPSVSS